jgi:hypothetical protein
VRPQQGLTVSDAEFQGACRRAILRFTTVYLCSGKRFFYARAGAGSNAGRAVADAHGAGMLAPFGALSRAAGAPLRYQGLDANDR